MRDRRKILSRERDKGRRKKTVARELVIGNIEIDRLRDREREIERERKRERGGQ